MLHFPNAKINIGLFVTEKRADGYHNIESVFYPLRQMKDALEVLPAAEGAESTLRFSGKKIEGEQTNNLVWKAYQLLKNNFPQQVKNIQIHLIKSIPMGAGLGGGSSDGTFMLRLLNKFFELELSDETLTEYALQLGSDCPFFVNNTPQMAKGRGEILSPVDLDLSDYSIQLICPKIHVATALAFSNITVAVPNVSIEKKIKLPLKDWAATIENVFEKTVFEQHSELAIIKQKLYNEGAIYAAMSGTGSALYGIFPKGKTSCFQTNETQEVFYFE